MRQPTKHFYEFGHFRLEATERRLLCDGQPVQLTAKVFDILYHGHLLEKQELIQAVWSDSFVEEGNLTRSISTLRKALSESESEYIETVPKCGYRFVAAVREGSSEDATLVVRERIQASVIVEEEEEAERQAEGVTERQRDSGFGAKDALPLSVSLSLSLSPSRFLHRQPSWFKALVGVLLIGLAAGGAYWWKAGRAKQTGSVAAVKSIAVLPFKPLNADNNDESLGLGLADTLITKLSGLQSLIVRPTSAVRKYSSPTQDPLAAGREQQVDAVLDASLQRDGERIRVTVRLLSMRDGKALWTYQCEEVRCDLFAMQDLISEEVAAALMPRLTGEERQRLRKHYTENREAWQAYARGVLFLKQRTPEGLRKGIEYFEQAIEKDSNYTLAYAGLADCYSLLGNYTFSPPKESFPRAKIAAQKALAIDDTLGEVHASLAKVLHLYDWNQAEAEREFQRAIALNPGYATAHQWYGEYLIAVGRFEEAKAELKRALELDPVSPSINTAQGFPYFYARKYDQAIAAYRQALELDPNFFAAHYWLAEAYEQKGMSEQAFAEYLAAFKTGNSAEWLEAVKRAYAVSGIRGYWQENERLVLIKDIPPQTYHSKYGKALTYARLGEKEEVFKWLHQAYADRDRGLAQSLKVHPLLDGLRDDPRFAELLRRVGLAR